MKKTEIKKLVFATNNRHKLDEARQIISDRFEVVSLAEIGCHDDIPETADTLEGNALIKARWVHDRYGYDCFADDTGLMVDALGGAPGVYSARYAGEHCTPADNVARLLGEMKDVENRDAHFSTVIALIADGAEHTFEGRVEGAIATEEHGNGGFGYDPVFVEKESGRCFAEMSADEKNAVSHRGRAMRKLCDFLGMILLVIAMFACGSARAQSWRLHPSYDGQMERIVDTPDYTYFLGASQEYFRNSARTGNLYGVLFRYDKKGDEMKYLNTQNLLSSNLPVAIEYNYDRKYLCIGYYDGNIDLLYDDGRTVNIPGLKLSDYEKKINSITIDPVSNDIYVATDFGYIVIDEKKGEVKLSRNMSTTVTAVVPLGDMLIAGTDNGLYYGPLSSKTLDDMNKIPGTSNALRLLPLTAEKLYVYSGDKWSRVLHQIVAERGRCRVEMISFRGEDNVERSKNGILLSNHEQLRWLRPDGTITQTDMYKEESGLRAGSYDGRDVWLSAGRRGLSRCRIENADGRTRTVLTDWFYPNVSSTFHATSMAYSPTYGMLVRNHGLDYNFNDANKNYTEVNDLISGYKDMSWSRLSATYREPDMKGLVYDNPNGLTIDPRNPDHVYCGSVRSGILRLDLKDPSKSLHLTKPSDFLGGRGEQGFVEFVEDCEPGVLWTLQCIFAAPSFDANGVLWSAFARPEPGVENSSKLELWYWTPEDRAASTSAANFRPWKKLTRSLCITGAQVRVLPLTASSNRNILVEHGGMNTSPLVLMDHNGTLDNKSDDKWTLLTQVFDQDGNEIRMNSMTAVYEDPTSGLVWMSNGSALFTFNPRELLEGSKTVRRIKVSRNDGTNLADYLLDGVCINCIINDQKGRKWFGTRDAGLVCTSSDGREIVATYTTDNSGIAGNTVYSMCYNPATNSLMVSTENGLCELFMSGSADGGTSVVRAYPNPVRPDYYGNVVIDGLESDAMVKIVDAAGNIIKDCGMAATGAVEWNVTNIFSKRVPGGVYYVLASNGPDSDSFARVAKILVVD